MTRKSGIRWTLTELTECMRKRQRNRFDVNIGVSGKRGQGKSTFLFKLFNSFKKQGFLQYRHQVYSQDDVKRLLCNQKFGYCWDDEAINTGYKRDFQKTGQIELIKIVTNYRDNFNIYGSALPFFYNLDKALRELIFMHVHLTSRGIGVVLLPLEGQIHTQDPWDTVTNKKIELKENSRLERDPNSNFRFHKLTTFAGYVFFKAMTERQEEKYLRIKERKRAKLFKDTDEEYGEKPFLKRLYALLMVGKLTREGLFQSCLIEGKKHSSISSALSTMLRDEGKEKKLKEFFRESATEKDIRIDPQVVNLVPDIPS
ncbi:MAG TPA: hypothetical protein ENI23_14590 [bacterium]|nr:hypothetical protein [bacterium]